MSTASAAWAEPVVAVATAGGRAAIAIVRLTGRGLEPILAGILPGVALQAGRARHVTLYAGDEPLDDGVVVWRPGPASYTGEDLCEFSIHGNPVLVGRLLEACVDLGARLAAPGEFTRRAVVNGRLDLVQAEGIDQLIRASSAGVALARAAVVGRLGGRLASFRAALVGVAAELEARLDWPSEDLTLQSDAALARTLRGVAAEARGLAETYTVGRRLVEGARVALVGVVNAGKSTLFNRLLGRERALVHPSPGTTRDVLEVTTRLGPLDVTLLDTAGERETADPIEAAGLALARELTAEVDLLVVVLRAGPTGPDDGEQTILARTEGRERLVVYNGVDRPEAGPPPAGALPISARSGLGVEDLRAQIVARLAGASFDGPAIASVRQRDLLRAVAAAAETACEAAVEAGPAAAAEQVVSAIAELDALTGADSREAVLDEVFARFCIGK